MAYEDFLMEDLSAHVLETFPASKGPWAIGGNSMGGFGAVRLGLKYPHRFFSVWSHSGGFPSAERLPTHWHWIGNPNDLDCYQLVKQLEPRRMPRLSFDYGTDDHLLEDNRRLHRCFEEHNIPHLYREHPGGHQWAYWNMHIKEALTQHQGELKKL